MIECCHQYEIRPVEEEVVLPLTHSHEITGYYVQDFKKAPYMKYVNTYCEGI